MNRTLDDDPAIDLKPLLEIIDEYKNQRGAVIPVLQRTQETYGYLPKPALKEISKRLRIPLSRLQGVATFYAQFHLKRRGRHLIRVCDGTACHVKGATKLVNVIEENLELKAGGSSPDYKYSLEIVYCVGSCGLAPVVIVDDRVVGQAEPDKLVRQLKRIED
ncbi:MAG: NAD(P)H-dependent oxidoreductase subunit E [Anaerolineales bacterium]|nr:NAD(P)H-dependent oxidoreductase subunit E [Anaerolineales bacterium]MCS7247336.1 NAD(P)H-dependent oxidoreductase subunit E [Anaerolineales bacterium]MDW8161147.1 NAD(P)H-dependent oxidoreductase subunit E [Anaerolineales bacterium]MDW8446961.1 NAD(P)H-dependent oxidoreductase subunit E [Anaerolineales bacterium]